MSERVTSRRWFRFGLRTFFVIVTVVAAWVGYECNWIRQRRQVLANYRFSGNLDANTSAPGMLWLFGEPGYSGLVLHVPERIPLELTAAEERELIDATHLFPEVTQNQVHWVPPVYTLDGTEE